MPLSVGKLQKKLHCFVEMICFLAIQHKNYPVLSIADIFLLENPLGDPKMVVRGYNKKTTQSVENAVHNV